MLIALFEENEGLDLWPLSATRPVGELRVGIMTIAEKWSSLLNAEVIHETRDYLHEKFVPVSKTADLQINAHALPTEELVKSILQLQDDQALVVDDRIIASRGNGSKKTMVDYKVSFVDRPFHIFKFAGEQIISDFSSITVGRKSLDISSTNTIIGSHPVFMEEGSKAECCIFNTTDGPIYIGKNAQIMEGSIIRGPFAMGEGSNVKMASKIYSNTALGPYCNVGGELNNVVMQGYSNKGHDGFLGNAVLGEWCNIGADSNCSNLKNTYDQVKVWNYRTSRFERSGEQFCGLIMGDHSKCGINTMFNTGTVVGVGCNIYGSGFPRQFVPDFSWGGANGFTTHKLPQMEKTAHLMMVRRNKEFDESEKKIIYSVFEQSKEWRNWED